MLFLVYMVFGHFFFKFSNENVFTYNQVYIFAIQYLKGFIFVQKRFKMV